MIMSHEEDGLRLMLELFFRGGGGTLFGSCLIDTARKISTTLSDSIRLGFERFRGGNWFGL